MKIDWLVAATIVGPILGAVAWAYISGFVERRPRIIVWLGHASAIQAQVPGGPTSTIHTHAVVVRNAGKKTATNVRLGHDQFPQSYSVFPALNYSVITTPGGGTEILFPTLAPDEQVTVTYLYFPPVTWYQINTYTRSDEGLARYINVLPTPQQPLWLLRVAAFLFLLGAAAAIYLLVQFTLWFVSRGHA